MKESDHDRLKELEARIQILENENRELTEQLQQGDSSTEDRALLMQVANASHVAITVLNRNGEITFINERAEKILGLEKGNILHRKYNDPEWQINDFEGHPLPDEQLPFQIVQRY